MVSCLFRWLKYIAAQGPLDHTVEDFWRMIYDQKISHVIMVTALKERDIRKCAKYWPEMHCPTPTSNNHFLVDCTSEQQNEGYTTRHLTVTRPTAGTGSSSSSSSTFKQDDSVMSGGASEGGGGVREICQCQFHDWPDHGVPQGTKNFINFIQRIRDFRKKCSASSAAAASSSSSSSTVSAASLSSCDGGAGAGGSTSDKHILVHCSAGIGRTGVVILTEACFNLIDLNKELPLIALLREMRAQRPQLIQNWAQFSFVCRSVLAYYEMKQRASSSSAPNPKNNMPPPPPYTTGAGVATGGGSSSANKQSVC